MQYIWLDLWIFILSISLGVEILQYGLLNFGQIFFPLLPLYVFFPFCLCSITKHAYDKFTTNKYFLIKTYFCLISSKSVYEIFRLTKQELKLTKNMRYIKNWKWKQSTVIAIKIIKEEDIQCHSLGTIIEDYKYLLEINKAIIKHIWRETNKYADFLANEDHKHNKNWIMGDCGKKN